MQYSSAVYFASPHYDNDQVQNQVFVTKKTNLQAITLYIYQNQFILEPNVEKTLISNRIIIDKNELSIKEQQLSQNILKPQTKANYSAFLGILPIYNQHFLVFAEFAKQKCVILKNTIYEVDGLSYVALTNGYEKDPKWQQIHQYLSYLNLSLMNSGYYFSYTYNLSLSKYQFAKGYPTNFKYCWNTYMCQRIYKLSEKRWFLPLIQGFVSYFAQLIQGLKLQYFLITRRSWKKGGTRYNARGIDTNGNVANFCQTEQIIVYNNYCCSHVQIRGSVPAFWKQTGLSAAVQFCHTKQINNVAFKKHFNRIKQVYSRIFCINLLSKTKSDEYQLTLYFEELIKQQQDQSIRYEYYDFHQACKNQKFENSTFLINKLSSINLGFKFYVQDLSNNNVRQIQNGIMRTNCLDCLDRTNFIQTKLAAQIFQQALVNLGIELVDQIGQSDFLNALDDNNNKSELVVNFKHIWADNGDGISIHYTGTGSTHTGITRTGKRDLKGMMDHTMKSLNRFIQQNIQDNYKQQAIDLLIGQHTQTLNIKQLEEGMKQIKE